MSKGINSIELPVVCTSGNCETDGVELTQRETNVFDIICQSENPVSFTRLKESTNLHQELVSRIVHRLKIHGLVKHTDTGYVCDCAEPNLH